MACSSCGSTEADCAMSTMRSGASCCPGCSDAPTGGGGNSYQVNSNAGMMKEAPEPDEPADC